MTIFKRLIKTIGGLLLLTFISWWLVLSPVSFPSENDAYYIYSKDKKWKVGVYWVSPTSPAGLYQFLMNKRYIVLYDANGHYIGQSTPFCFMTFDESNILFPSITDDHNLWFIPETCDYTIQVRKPAWWSQIIHQTNRIFHVKPPKGLELHEYGQITTKARKRFPIHTLAV
ncbi:hypothetical protein VA7868_01904 [Vibrio aerogenes CECT 7868]|uniref:Uncharacterized protein n=1 Tax=Vibrio aerogenes CECT 7868 TaxID=1216006 RepID=A0A1M5YQ77_9VIBR|nr:DUF6201 family protein [Vibrio aerogenes]SHI14225.1 hypothetical protein VA7868_01904 [Vibrio aerogenes CECT 7868]